MVYHEISGYEEIWNLLGEYQLQSFGQQIYQESASDIKIAMEDLLEGKSIETEIDEEIIFDQLGESSEAIWSLLLASGYLKADGLSEEGVYQLSLTNLEVMKEFRRMIQGWFKKSIAATIPLNRQSRKDFTMVLF